MADDWDSGGTGKKKGLPKWLMFCGGGCLLIIIAIIVMGLFFKRWIDKGSDPEIQWPKIEKVLPYDERHPDYEFVWGNKIPFVGVEVYLFKQRDEALAEGSARLIAMLLKFPSGSADEAATMLDPDQHDGQATAAVVTVQGRELDAVRLMNEKGGSPFPGAPPQEEGAMIFIDATLEGSLDPLIVMLIRENSKDEVTDEDAVAFLAPFQVGPDR